MSVKKKPDTERPRFKKVKSKLKTQIFGENTNLWLKKKLAYVIIKLSQIDIHKKPNP